MPYVCILKVYGEWQKCVGFFNNYYLVPRFGIKSQNITCWTYHNHKHNINYISDEKGLHSLSMLLKIERILDINEKTVVLGLCDRINLFMNDSLRTISKIFRWFGFPNYPKTRNCGNALWINVSSLKTEVFAPVSHKYFFKFLNVLIGIKSQICAISLRESKAVSFLRHPHEGIQMTIVQTYFRNVGQKKA